MKTIILIFCFSALLMAIKIYVFIKKENNNGYYVYCPNARKPRYVHNDVADARNEAIRLSKLCPGEEFKVLQILDTFQENKVKTELIDLDEIPF